MDRLSMALTTACMHQSPLRYILIMPYMFAWLSSDASCQLLKLLKKVQISGIVLQCLLQSYFFTSLSISFCKFLANVLAKEDNDTGLFCDDTFPASDKSVSFFIPKWWIVKKTVFLLAHFKLDILQKQRQSIRAGETPVFQRVPKMWVSFDSHYRISCTSHGRLCHAVLRNILYFFYVIMIC